jgi:hypothetical protein
MKLLETNLGIKDNLGIREGWKSITNENHIWEGWEGKVHPGCHCRFDFSGNDCGLYRSSCHILLSWPLPELKGLSRIWGAHGDGWKLLLIYSPNFSLPNSIDVGRLGMGKENQTEDRYLLPNYCYWHIYTQN